MAKISEHKLKQELRQFIGTERYYFLPSFKRFKYTEGVKYLAEQAEAYWLLEYIFCSQPHRILRGKTFQMWNLKVQEDESAIITVEDENDNVLATFNINYTDFPLHTIDLWLVDKILTLPSEY